MRGNVLHVGDGGLSFLIHGSQVLLRSDDHVGVLLLLAAVLRVHLEVHGVVEA